MEKTERRAYAKINLGLDVLRRRENGYHDVKMVMQTVGIYDELTFEKIKEGIIVTTDKEELPTDKGNLIYRAAELLTEKYQIQEGIRISLKKNIPIAAGMAGGSTDAAAVFHGMNTLFNLHMDEKTMREEGVKIGADVPYCIMGGTALSEGIGEVLTALPAPPKAVLCIAKPDINVSTKFVYENLHIETVKDHPDIDGMVQAIREGDLRGIKDRMANVLETVTVKEYPIIQEIKKKMLECGAENALMSRSGPTVFGVFTEETGASEAMERIRKEKLAQQVFVTEFVNM